VEDLPNPSTLLPPSQLLELVALLLLERRPWLKRRDLLPPLATMVRIPSLTEYDIIIVQELTDTCAYADDKQSPMRSCVYHFFESTATAGTFHCKFAHCHGALLRSADGTGNLLKHLSAKHLEAYRAVKEAIKNQQPLDMSKAESLIHGELRGCVNIAAAFSKARTPTTTRALKLLIWLVVDGLPFDTVESPRFRDFCSSIGLYKPPSARHLLRYLPLLCNAVELIISRRLGKLDFVSVSVDAWTSNTQTSYLSIHMQGYTEQMELEHCEDLVRFPSPHDASRYKQLITDRINYRTSSRIMLVSITADGASVVQSAGAQIVGKEDVHWCLAHLLQLAVKGVIDDVTQPYKANIALVREWINVLRDHGSLREKLEECREKKQVPMLALDVPTRWDSTLKMVRSFLRAWDGVISPMVSEGLLDGFIAASSCITQETLCRLEAMCNILEHVSTITQLAGSKEFPAIVHVPRWIAELLDNLVVVPGKDTIDSSAFKDMLRAQLEIRTHNITGTPSIYLAVAVLDPAQHDLTYLPNSAALLKAVDSELATQIVLLNPQRELESGEVMCAADISDATREVIRYHEHCNVNRTQIQANIGCKRGTEALRCIEEWWRDHCTSFPLMARAARGLLATQATSVNNERAFSEAGAVFNQHRQSMRPETLVEVSLIRGNIGQDLTPDEIIEAAREVSAMRQPGVDIFAELEQEGSI